MTTDAQRIERREVPDPRRGQMRRAALGTTTISILALSLFSTAPRAVQVRDVAAPTTTTVSVGGRVMAADTGDPVRGAQIILLIAPNGGQENRYAVTDTDGRWQVTDLAPARYLIRASKTGYVTGYYGQRHPAQLEPAIEITAGARRTDLDIKLFRGGVIAGRIVDEFGDPVSNVSVGTARYQYLERRAETRRRRW